jgi:hypothetical protein
MKENKELTYEMVMQMFAETNKKIDKQAKNIGGIDRSNGLMAEEAIYNSLSKDNVFANVKFDYIRKNIQLQSEDHRTLSELDILMVNGDTIAIIEVKFKVEKKDIKNILNKQLKHFRQIYPKYNNHKIILGIGGMSFEKEVEEEAKNNGIGIIKIVGDKVEFHTNEIKEY